ncbi:hypothetical protein DP939_42015 [Spongiactinospora rosea]|uniref:MacB-like periplasmic core domain-containing protein n=2 Tax=Spongiactinospora rosea TaxID=2248750 RepID=A0A366LLV8_9ACTN|nr:hypothetical protein DP939_42015 [Spongiactinospora rosea]
MACGYMVRLPAVLLTLSVGLSCVHAGQEVLNRAADRRVFAQLGNAVTVKLSGSFAREAEGEITTAVGRWVRRADKAGQIILVHPSLIHQRVPQARSALIVNQTFIAKQGVMNPTGHLYQLRPQGKENLQLIVPQALASHTSSILAAVREELSATDKAGARIEAETLPAKTGQMVFTYGATRSIGQGSSVVEDPVLVVVPNGSTIVSDGAYTASVTHDEVIFTDPQDVLHELNDPQLRGVVLALSPVAEKSAVEYRRVILELRLSAVTLALALAVLFMAAIGVSIVHTRKNAQAVFVKHISGWRFLAIYRVMFGAELLLLTLPLIWTTWQKWDVSHQVAAYTAAGLPPPPRLQAPEVWETLLAAEVAGTGLLMIFTALAVFHRRIVHEGAAVA